MKRVLVFGNSGAGKSTLARQLSIAEGLAHFDLDTLAWLPTTPPQRAPLAESAAAINEFMRQQDNWVIDGCYTDLLQIAVAEASEIIFLNLPVEDCVNNARKRPWEPHKYASKQAQDANLDMLLDWIRQYHLRQDEFSLRAHLDFYERFAGSKRMLIQNQDWTPQFGQGQQ